MELTRTGWDWRTILPLGLGAIGLGFLLVTLGYGNENPSHGAGLALVAALAPLVGLCVLRFPQALFQVLSVVLAVNCFGFLTNEAVFFRAVAALAIALLVLRLGRYDIAHLRLPTTVLLFTALGTLGAIALHPGIEEFSLGVIWMLPFLAFFVGYGLQREYPASFRDLWLSVAVLGGLALASVNLYQWLESGLQFRSYVVIGAFNNGNVTAAVIAFFVPSYLVMTTDRRGWVKAIGLGMLLLTLLSLLVIVSRFALAMVILAPVLFYTRRIPAVSVVVLAALFFFGLLSAGFMAPASTLDINASGPAAHLARTFRIGVESAGEVRQLGYLVAATQIKKTPVEGIGLGGGRDLALRNGLDTYGPENLFIQTWLEGGYVLLVPTLLLWSFFGYTIWMACFNRLGRSDVFTYALGLSCLLITGYDMGNSTQSHMSLRTFYVISMGAIWMRLWWLQRGWNPDSPDVPVRAKQAAPALPAYD